MSRLGSLTAGFAVVTLASPSQPEPELTVFAAASLSAPFQELGTVFERTHPGTRVRFNFAGSQQLAVQLEHGAAADLFASADERWMSYLAERELLAEPPRLFAHNRLVAIVPNTNPARIERLQDLARRGVKIVVAAEPVPVGAYTLQVLARLSRAPGFPADYERRVLDNVASQEENVKAVVAKVRLGEADAGIVYASDATGSSARNLQVLTIPEAQNIVADYPLATLARSRAPEAAAAFAGLVLRPEGQRVLQRHGLIPVALQTGLLSPAPTFTSAGR